MTSKPTIEFVHEGRYAAEVAVTLIDSENEIGWGPYFSLDDAEKLEAVRLAQRRGDLAAASALAQVYELTPSMSPSDLSDTSRATDHTWRNRTNVFLLNWPITKQHLFVRTFSKLSG